MEGGSDTSSVHKLAESLSVIVETLNSASKGKSKGKDKKGQWAQDSSTGGQWQGTSQNVAAIASRGRSLKKQEEPSKSPRRKAKAKAKVEEKPKAKERPQSATCAEGLGVAQGCAPAEDGLTTWSRTRLKERTPMKKAAGLIRTKRHSNWGALAAILV